jgi:thymidylate kinase
MNNFDKKIAESLQNAESMETLELFTAARLARIQAKIWQARKDGDRVLVRELQDSFIEL